MRLRELRDTGPARPLLEAEPLATVRMRNLLFRLRPPGLRAWADDPDSPQAVLVNNDEFWDLYAADTDTGRRMLDALPATSGEQVFAGLDPALAAHLRERHQPVFDTPCTLFVLPDVAALPGAAPEIAVGELGPQHADQVTAAWPLGTHEGFDKRGYLASRIAGGPTAAVFAREDGRVTPKPAGEAEAGGEAPAAEADRLASFVLTHADGSLGVLHTEPAFRGRGLARAVLTAQARRISDRGAPVFGYVVAGNAAGERVMEAVGLVPVRAAVWLGVR